MPDVSTLTPDQCAADFVIRRATRKKYPGACSLEFQNIMKIIIEKIFLWDQDKQSSDTFTPLGDINGWIQAAEEQGRGSLHAHWIIFTKQLSSRIRQDLFHPNIDKRLEARLELASYIDCIIDASFGTDLKTTHACKVKNRNSSHSKSAAVDTNNDCDIKPRDPEEVFKSVNPQIFRDARHKVLSSLIGGKMLMCKTCKRPVSHEDLFKSTLKQFARKKRVCANIYGILSPSFFYHKYH